VENILPPNFSQPATARVEKFKGLKADPHSANGGIGVSYSNVMLGGATNFLADNKPSLDTHTTYKNHFARDKPL